MWVGLEINAARYSILEKWQEMGWNRYEVDELKGFTDKNGYFSGFSSSEKKLDGSPMRLCITQKTKDGKEIKGSQYKFKMEFPPRKSK